MDDEQFKILVAEDSLTDRQALEVTLSEANHISLMAKSGAEALEQIDEFQPDIIIIEVNMAELSGIETAKRIREDIEFESVPILFLTCVMCSELIAQCIDAGGTDFIEKPYDKLILASKINALGRMRRLTYELIEQNAKNEANHSRLLQEQTVAKKVFDQLSSKGVMDQDYFRYSMSPLAVFNGDVIVADVSPTGHLFILIGDFTGHGLPAAIGSLPLVNTFYGMVKKGFSISEIMSEINQKLHDILPTGIFCCATCIDINPEERQLCYWAGGLPEGLIYRHKDQTFESLVSRHLPLGVLSSNKFSAKTERTLLKEGDRIYLWSDGIHEARNSQGAMFGEDGLHELMENNKCTDDLFNEILKQVHSFIGPTEKDDDISLVEVPFNGDEYKSIHLNSNTISGKSLADWSMNLTLETSTLKQFDPLPLVSNIVNQVKGLSPYRTKVYNVIAELYSNSLEHGLLKLNSDLKETSAGFIEYYDRRKKLLNDLQEGCIVFDITHTQKDDDDALTGELKIKITDTGSGFNLSSDLIYEKEDYKERNSNTKNDKNSYFGRGLALIKSACERVHIKAPGNVIEVVITW